MIELIAETLGSSMVSSIFGVYGAYRGVLKKRNSMLLGRELTAIFFISWLLSSICTFLLVLLLAVFRVPLLDKISIIISGIFAFIIARRLIETKEQKKGIINS